MAQFCAVVKNLQNPFLPWRYKRPHSWGKWQEIEKKNPHTTKESQGIGGGVGE